MGAVVSLATAPLSMAATCCGSILGSCAASMLCKACSCFCMASPRVSSALYFGTLMLFVFMAWLLRQGDGDIVIGGGFNQTEARLLDQLAHRGTQGALDYWNSRFYCAPAHPSGFIICCANRCSGVFAVYRFSFALCLFFAFLMLCTLGTSKFGARAHRGFWVGKIFILLSLTISTVFVDNDAMAAYREVARFTSFLFIIMQNLLLIDFGYRINEWLVDLDERSESESMCNWKMALLGGCGLLYAAAITMWVLEAQWFGHTGCAAQQTIITITILLSVVLSIISCTKIAPHGTLFTSGIVSAYAAYQAYSALSAHPDNACNGTAEHGATSDLLVGLLVFIVAMVSMAMSAWSATSSKDAIIGKSSGNSELTVTLETGSGSEGQPAAADEDEAVGPESWWYYHLMMVVVSLYFAMLLSNWSTQPVDEVRSQGHFTASLTSFWIKVAAQWVCLLMYAWTLLAPYLLRDVRDFGIEFDF